MALCQLCVPWNLPLTIPSHRSAEGSIVPLPFQDWLWYHWHVVMHQTDNWKGEIETFTQELLDKTQESVAS